jgi:hypothetical protein
MTEEAPAIRPIAFLDPWSLLRALSLRVDVFGVTGHLVRLTSAAPAARARSLPSAAPRDLGAIPQSVQA